MPHTKTALITGASHRIGLALSKVLHEVGFDIALHYCQSKNAAKLIETELNSLRPNSAKAFQVDLTLSSKLQVFCDDVFNWRPNLKVLINNASIFLNDPLALKHWDNLFNCNTKAPYLLSQYCFNNLQENQGSIINITDIHSGIPLKDYGIYCMTKAALDMQTKQLAIDFAPDVRVNAIAPGAILWPDKDNEMDHTAKESLIQTTPLKKIGGVKPITQAALHIIENDFLTGQSINIDGGRSLYL